MSDAETLLEQFAPTRVAADLAGLADDVRRALPHLVAAMRGMDDLYRRQIGPEAVEAFARLADGETPIARALRHYNGPYDKLGGGVSFVDGVPEALPQKAVYPRDLDEAEFDAWIEAHPADKQAFLSPYTVIVRDGDGLAAVPYGAYYAEQLGPVARELELAAGELGDGPFAGFLRNRARALGGAMEVTDSDAEWVQLKAPLEVVIGPFEVYEDDLKGLKAFYEGMLFVVDDASCARLAEIETHLEELAAAIPTPEGSRPARGGMAPMIVADEVIATGEGYAGILASAFNLPNDPGVRARVGWKQVMIKNVMQAKFDTCTAAIARELLGGGQAEHLSFDAYFFFVLLHEVTHGLGPAYRADGRSINEACAKFHSTIEEAKADTGSLVLLCQKNGSCGIPALPLESIAATYLAGLYRSSRFGLHEAHGKANVIQYCFLSERGALTVESEGVVVHPERLAGAAVALLDELTRLQAAGAPREIEAFLERYGTPPASLESAIADLALVPVDILPQYAV